MKTHADCLNNHEESKQLNNHEVPSVSSSYGVIVSFPALHIQYDKLSEASDFLVKSPEVNIT